MTPNPRDILHVPGRLSVNPTNLQSEYPHGGTALGICRAKSIRIESGVQYITAEEFGGERIEGVYTGEGIALAAVLRSWDSDMLQRVFPNTTVGATSGHRVVSAPGTNRAGHLLSSRSVVLVFTPDDVDQHPMLVIRRALPAIDEAKELNLHLSEEWGVGVVFVGIRNTSGILYDYGMRADLTA